MRCRNPRQLHLVLHVPHFLLPPEWIEVRRLTEEVDAKEADKED